MSWFSIAFNQAIITMLAVPAITEGATIKQAQDLYNDIILSHDARTRPIQNQSMAVEVAISASILSLLAVDEVRQSISVNLLVRLTWTDEIRRWTPSSYGDLTMVDLSVGDLWVPKLLNGNSVSRRDTFSTDYAPLFMLNQGRVIHAPGGILHTACLMDMTHYPFDSQTCGIELISGSSQKFVQLTPSSTKLEKESYIENSEWELLNTSMTVSETEGSTYANFEIHIKRKPGHIVLTILVPVNIVSCLSSLVFLIPVDSGERVSFSITALLALSVYTSEVSTHAFIYLYH